MKNWRNLSLDVVDLSADNRTWDYFDLAGVFDQESGMAMRIGYRAGCSLKDILLF